MKILSVDISRLVTFKFAEISRLQAEFPTALTIIIGDNGSGKSSLMRQLTPVPPVRSDYEAGGIKQMLIEHQGSVYKLVSDFSNKGSPHSFIKDDVELNDGGTTDVQNELVGLHLGFDQKSRDILNGTHDFCKMSSGIRRTLLIESNPAHLGFILDYHKKVNTRVRMCKTNLTMLQERKIVLESKFLDEAALEMLRKESDELNQLIAGTIGDIGTVRGILSHYDPALRRPRSIETYTQSVVAFRRFVLPRLALWTDLDRSQSHGQMVVVLQTEIAHLEDSIVPLHAEMSELASEINTYTDRVREITDPEAVDEIELRIKAIGDELSSLQPHLTTDPISESEIGEADDRLDELKGILTEFLHCTMRLVPQKIYRLKQDKLRQARITRQQIFKECTQLDRRSEQLRRSQTIGLEDIPDRPCAKMACPLYATFKTAYDEVKTELTSNFDRTHHLQSRLFWIERFVTGQSQQLEDMQAHQSHLSHLHELLGHITCYRQFFKSPTVLKTIQSNPMVLFHRVEDYVKRSRATHKIRQLETQLLQEEFQLSKSRDVADTERQRLSDLIASRQTRLYALQIRISKLETALSTKTTQRRIIDDYRHVQDKLKALQEEGRSLTGHHRQYEEKSLLQDLVARLEDRQRDSVSRLGQINSTIREQDTIRARYSEEVVEQISVIEAQKKDWEDLEKALSRIPHIHTVSFINALIGTMNAYISKVFTYDFKIVPVDADKPLDYKFPMMVGSTPVPDISEGSEAQQEIVNLVFRLAMQKLLKLTDCPIYLDECGKTFDITHKQKLLDLLRHVLEERLVSQMFLINHHALVHEGLTNAQTLVLNDTNIMTPPSYNEHVRFNQID